MFLWVSAFLEILNCVEIVLSNKAYEIDTIELYNIYKDIMKLTYGNIMHLI